MRRGLMQWDPDELPVEVLAGRLARLRETMRRERFDAFLAYTNLVRPSAVTWLTGFTPYWSEGALLVLGDGPPMLATALSKRVAGWIRSSDPVSEIAHAPRPGGVLGERLAAAKARRLGVLERDQLPTGLADDLSGAAPELEMVDASAAFARLRAGMDEAERRLIDRANAIASAALRCDAAQAKDAGTVVGTVEQQARFAGAEEAYVAVAPDLDAGWRFGRAVRPAPLGARFAVRASVAYKGAWVRRTCTFARDEAGRAAAERAETWFVALCSTLNPGESLSAQIAAKAAAIGAEVREWMAESAVGSYPLQVVAARNRPVMPLPRDFAVVTVALTLNGIPWIGAAPVVRAQRALL